MNKEEFRNALHNKIFFGINRFNYPFKPKNIGYVSNDEAIYISGMFNYSHEVSKIIDEFIDENWDRVK